MANKSLVFLQKKKEMKEIFQRNFEEKKQTRGETGIEVKAGNVIATE